MAEAQTADAQGQDNHHEPTGWRRFVYSTNHKDIGTMYLIFSITAGLIGGAFSVHAHGATGSRCSIYDHGRRLS